MITLHKLNGAEFILNNNHIETIESTPDSVITLMNEKKYIVKESAEEIIQKIREYQTGVLEGLKRA
ncbi:MAG TPA: flagellar FlbD family protein [Spirochaetota bacterium]|jgi:flagellar protein FlbD|nr:flagellar FlbD family protein [Spirochaetota bacterium]HPV42699.1 flagellar FlbD family protein [Spirochaetota bacterium]